MKKVLTICLLLTGLTQLSAKEGVRYHKSNGGLFGYKMVTTTNWPDLGITVVACKDPGVTRCRAAAAITMPDGSVLSAETLESIDRAVTSLLTPENTLGSVIVDGTYYVKYNYNVDADDLAFEVYTLDGAREEGLIQ